MGMIEPMTIVSALPSTGLVLASPTVLWVGVVGTLVVAALGVWSAVPRRRVVPRVRLVQPAVSPC